MSVKVLGLLHGQNGDQIIQLPLIKKIKTNVFPGCHYTANINKKYESIAPLVRTSPYVDDIYISDDYENFLKKSFWKERTFWGDGYFCCSIGNASPGTIKKYIDEQG